MPFIMLCFLLIPGISIIIIIVVVMIIKMKIRRDGDYLGSWTWCSSWSMT